MCESSKAIEAAVAILRAAQFSLMDVSTPGFVFEQLNNDAGQWLYMAVDVGEFEIEALEGEDAEMAAMLAAVPVEGNA